MGCQSIYWKLAGNTQTFQPAISGRPILIFDFIFGAPEEMNLGTGKKSSCCLDVLLSGKQLEIVAIGSRHKLDGCADFLSSSIASESSRSNAESA
jgi:hypothetical protein